MRKKLKEIVKTVLHMDGDPKKIAFAFAIGVYIAFFPIMGIHTIMAFAGAWLFGLSPVVILAGTLVNNPWTIALVYGSSLYTGMIITGRSLSELEINWSGLNMELIIQLVKVLGIPFVIGCTLLGILSAAASYLLTLRVVISYR